MVCHNSYVRHFELKKDWPSPPATPVKILQLTEKIRHGQAVWQDLKPDLIYVKIDNGMASFTSLSGLISWLEQHQLVEASEIFVRWTENGDPAAVGMNSVFLRIGKPTTVSVASPNEAACRGFLDTIADRLQSFGAYADPPLVTKEPSETATKASVNNRKGRLRSVINNPWFCGIGVTVIGGIIVTVILRSCGLPH